MTDPDLLGRCPECPSPIPREGLLIRYDRADGTAMYAECRGCGQVVHPSEGPRRPGNR